jgi:polyhydroxybutyrate depolymerase
VNRCSVRTITRLISAAVILIPLLLSPQCRNRQGDCERCVVRQMEHRGLSRSYILYEPERRPAGPVPLIIVMHGGGGTASGMIRMTRKRFNVLADREGLLVVYPEGFDRHWNDFRVDANDRAHNENVDDVGFISALIDLLVREKGADPRRVFATGISNGGFMSYRLACQLSDKIRAIAPVTAAMPVNPRGECAPGRPVPVLIMNGTKDPLVPYNGGEIRLLGVSRGFAKSTGETVNIWVKQNACSEKSSTVSLPDKSPEDDSTVEKTVYPSTGGIPCVTLYTIRGGGHTWPGGQQYLGKRLVGTANRDISGCDEIWDFFRQVR